MFFKYNKKKPVKAFGREKETTNHQSFRWFLVTHDALTRDVNPKISHFSFDEGHGRVEFGSVGWRGEKGTMAIIRAVAITRARTISHDAENPTPQTRDDRFPCTLRKPQKMHACSQSSHIRKAPL